MRELSNFLTMEEQNIVKEVVYALAFRAKVWQEAEQTIAFHDILKEEGIPIFNDGIET